MNDIIKQDLSSLELPVQVIETDLFLPKSGPHGSAIRWSSSHPHIMDGLGRLAPILKDADIILTATLESGNHTGTKQFRLTCRGTTPQALLHLALDTLEIYHGIRVLFESIVLPKTWLDHVHVSWESSDESCLSSSGELILPRWTTTVTLTAHLSIGDHEAVKAFEYLLIGSDDVTSDMEPRNMIERWIHPEDLFLMDNGCDLALGSFDHLMMKDQHLVLSGASLQGCYISPAFVSEPYVRIQLLWGSVTHAEARTFMDVRSMENAQWSDWEAMGDWGYGGENQPVRIVYEPSRPSTHFQYRITLKRSSPRIQSPRLHSVSMQWISVSKHHPYFNDSLPRHVFYPLSQLRQADTEDSGLWNNICWATSVVMVLKYLGKLRHLKIPQAYYAPLIRKGTQAYGTTKNDIGATQFGIHVAEIEFDSVEMLLYVLYRYGPVIVGVSKGQSKTGTFGPLTFNSGHVVVVVGYSIAKDGTVELTVNDPAVSWIREPFTGLASDFMLVWDKGGVVMMLP